jgi:hypothetical protein
MTGYLQFLYPFDPCPSLTMPAEVARSGMIDDSSDSALASLLQSLQPVPVVDTCGEKLRAILGRFSLGSAAIVILKKALPYAV